MPEKYIAVQMRAGDIRKEAAWRRQGLLGAAPIMPVHPESSAGFIARGGRIPAPMQSLKN